MILLLAACTGGAPPIETTDTDTGTEVTFTLPPDLQMSDGANYSISSTWESPSTQVASAPAEVLVGWATHTTDVTGAARAADSFAHLVLLEVDGTANDLLDAMGRDQLEPLVRRTFGVGVQGATDAVLSDLPGFDPTVELVEDPGTIWLLGLADAVQPRLVLADAILLVPSEDQPGISITIPDGAASFAFTAQIDGIDTLRTDAGAARYTVDWSALTADAYGEPFDPARIDQVFVGRFDDVDEADDLAGDVLDLEGVASGFWTVAPTGTTADLSAATDAGGAPFPGFEVDVAWLVGGRCTTCFGAAPLWMAVVEVREP